MRALKFLLPLALFIGVAWFLLLGLDRNPREIPSPLLDKPAPQVTLPMLSDPAMNWSTAQMKGQVWLLNVWGSWCAGCRVEHPLLNDLAARKLAPIVGLAWKDDPTASQAWLARLGNPYAINVADQKGLAAIDWGVYGAPETFVIDKAGIVRHKHIGPLTADAIERQLVPLLTRLKAQ